MTYIIAAIIGFVIGLGVEYWLLSPKMLERYEKISGNTSNAWENAKRTRRAYLDSLDKEDSGNETSVADENDENTQETGVEE